MNYGRRTLFTGSVTVGRGEKEKIYSQCRPERGCFDISRGENTKNLKTKLNSMAGKGGGGGWLSFARRLFLCHKGPMGG